MLIKKIVNVFRNQISILYKYRNNVGFISSRLIGKKARIDEIRYVLNSLFGEGEYYQYPKRNEYEFYFSTSERIYKIVIIDDGNEEGHISKIV